MNNVEFDGRRIQQALSELQQSIGDLRPVLKDIGEELVPLIKRRFSTKIGTDGRPWIDNSPMTIERKGRNWPLTGGGGEHGAGGGTLGDTINYQLFGNDELHVGSPMEYAVTQQFGAAQGEFGNNRRGSPIPWGDIPARPFLGITADDETKILDIIQSYLVDQID